MKDQLIFSITVATAKAATMAMKENLILLYADPFLNFSENIGTSLTISRASTIDTIGMKYVP